MTEEEAMSYGKSLSDEEALKTYRRAVKIIGDQTIDRCQATAQSVIRTTNLSADAVIYETFACITILGLSLGTAMKMTGELDLGPINERLAAFGFKVSLTDDQTQQGH